MPEPLKSAGSVEIFCSYSHKDEPLRAKFQAHVSELRRRELVQVWYDREISAGENWAGKIDEHLNSADIITLFVSADFLASDYCYEKELSRALEREAKKEAFVVPIIVRPCDWNDAPFASLQAIPKGAKAVTTWRNRDEAWTDVAKSLKITVRRVLSNKLDKLGKQTDSLPMGPAPGTDEFAEDRQRAQAIYAEIVRDAAANREERQRIMANLQSKILELNVELGPTHPRAKQFVSEMDKYIKD